LKIVLDKVLFGGIIFTMKEIKLPETKSVKISIAIYKRLKAVAKEDGRFISKLLDRVVDNYLIGIKK